MGNNKSDYILAKFDVGGIQDYIFATNRLRENAGASYKVTRIMEEFLLESFREAADEKNVEVLLDWKLADRLRLPQDERMMAEVIYIGGGNAVALFRNLEFFCRAGEKLGIKAAVKCQGVYLTAAYIETDLSDFAADRRRLDQEMNEKKKHMIRGTLIKILSIINVCFRYWTMESAMDIRKRWTSFPESMGKTAWLRSSTLTATGWATG